MNFDKEPTLKPETEEYVYNTVEKRINMEMPISFTELENICEENELTQKAFSEMMRYAQAYIADVWDMKELLQKRDEYSPEEWRELHERADDARTRLHNTFIDSIAILSRTLNKYELPTDWVKKLAPLGKLDRATCGKFAIMLVYSKYVNSTKGKDNG